MTREKLPVARVARFDPQAAADQVPIIGWYDTAEFEYPKLPHPTELVGVPDEIWADMAGRIAGGYLVDRRKTPPAIVKRAPPTDVQLLAQAKRDKSVELDRECQIALASFSSTGLGEAHSYAARAIDQSNLTAARAAGRARAIWCADGAGAWRRVQHTAEQVAKVHDDMLDAIERKLDQLHAKLAEVQAATSGEAVSAISFS
jgi:hypothetical protein